MRCNTSLPIIVLTAVLSGCIDAPDTVRWSGHNRQDVSVTSGTDTQNEPDIEVDESVSDLAPVLADGFINDGYLDLDSPMLDASADISCAPSDEVCDGLDNNCSGEMMMTTFAGVTVMPTRCSIFARLRSIGRRLA